MTLTVYDYAKKSASKNATPKSGLVVIIRNFIDALIAEDKACQDYFNHGDNRDPNTNGGKCPTGVTVSIYYAPYTEREYQQWEVIFNKSNTMYVSGKRRIAVRGEGGVYKFYLANHTGGSTAGMRDNSSYIYTEINLAK